MADISYRPATTPRRATDHEPGSRGKIDAMIERRIEGTSLFHPEDAGMGEAPIARALAEMYAELQPEVYELVNQGSGKRQFRAQPLDEATGRRVHLGYFETRAEAVAAVIVWRAGED